MFRLGERDLPDPLRRDAASDRKFRIEQRKIGVKFLRRLATVAKRSAANDDAVERNRITVQRGPSASGFLNRLPEKAFRLRKTNDATVSRVKNERRNVALRRNRDDVGVGVQTRRDFAPGGASGRTNEPEAVDFRAGARAGGVKVEPREAASALVGDRRERTDRESAFDVASVKARVGRELVKVGAVVGDEEPSFRRLRENFFRFLNVEVQSYRSRNHLNVPRRGARRSGSGEEIRRGEKLGAFGGITRL